MSRIPLTKPGRGLTPLLVWMLLLVCLAAGGLFLFVIIYLSESGNAALYPPFAVAFTVFFIALALILAFLYFRVLRPLRNSEKMILDNYDEIQKDKSVSMGRTGLDEMTETVITRQRDSWHRELTANLLRQKAELAGLQSQINPHFLYNTLDSIRGFALMKKVPEIAEMTEALSQLFRNNTRKSGMMVTLFDELSGVENYILIQRFRFQDRFTFEKQFLDDENKLLQCKIPSFIIQPVIENAIYHGLETTHSAGKILLTVHRTQSRLVVQVTDNGCGIPGDKLNHLVREINSPASDSVAESSNDLHTGIGLVNINQRIKMQYGGEYGLSIASTVNIGTQVEITLPYDA